MTDLDNREKDIRGIVKEAIHESWHDASGINSTIDKATYKLAALYPSPVPDVGCTDYVA